MKPIWVGCIVLLGGICGAVASPLTEGIVDKGWRVAAFALGVGLTHLLCWLADPSTFVKKLQDNGGKPPAIRLES